MTRLKYPLMVTAIPEGRHEHVAVQHFTVDANGSMATRLSATIQQKPDLYVPEGRYAGLRIHGTLVMSDTPMEQQSNAYAVCQAEGDVLIGGLGLGMITIPILQKRTVTSVTVVEKEAGVIALVEPAVRAFVKPRQAAKLRVIHDDVRTWRPERKGRQFNTQYFDIWSDICSDNLTEMKTLRRRFAPFLREGGWSRCWKEADLRRRE